ncbi:hypothetical protein BG015_007161 [Linnemannia schmuckeri]|uniref:HCP-like protein n=1 Tax=Linnemannia schmuckeri TaxID=64567 RepID=A0A9P5S8T3_9FUNG|nr:hypothetical protein BG015_007161 [Linnemannia schmuckeri]
MENSVDSHQDDTIQVIRLTGNKSKTVHITTHQDPLSGKPIVLWGDILRVFRDALYLQHGQRVLPFLKSSDFKDLDPSRIAAIPGAVLKIIVECSPLVDDATGPAQESTRNMTQEPPQKEAIVVDVSVRRIPVWGDELEAMENYTHIDRPSLSARGPQLYPGSLEDDDNDAKDTAQDQQVDIGIGYPENPMVKGEGDYEGEEVIRILEEDARLHDREARTRDAVTRKLAELGDAEAQYQTGNQYGGWHNVDSKNYVQATEWYLKAAKQGHVGAQHAIGELREKGHGCPINLKAAFEWYLKAAEGGNTFAQMEIGKQYENGSDVQQDLSKSFEWYLKAAEGGNPLAQRHVGGLYGNGRGGAPEDDLKAFEWYMKAAVQGNSSAQLLVAEMYCTGYEGLPQDLQKAKKWYERTGQSGKDDAWCCLDALKKKISRRQKRQRQHQVQQL